MAKLVRQGAAFEVMDTCLQIHGNTGYMRDYEIERMARDAPRPDRDAPRPDRTGTDDVLREILGRTLGL